MTAARHQPGTALTNPEIRDPGRQHRTERTAMTETAADRMLAEIHDWAATLPTRCPTLLRVGSGVLDELKRSAEAAVPPRDGQPPYGVTVVENATYPPGMWRIFDQWDDEISAGVLPVPGATLDVANRDGTSSRMRVLTVRRDEQRRIVEYTVADAAICDEMPYATRWLGQ